MPKMTRKQKMQRSGQEFGQDRVQKSTSVAQPKFFENKILFPKNCNQELALSSLATNILTILTGPPGTAKTLLSLYTACQFLERREIEKIYYVKPIVDIPSVAGLGFLPGKLNEKIEPLIASAKDALQVFMPKQKAEYMLEKQIIEFLPIEHLRGRSLNYCYIIGDEIQNATSEIIFTLLTRLGNNSKMAILGDTAQRDLKSKYGKDGLSDVLDRLFDMEGIGHINFTFDDICRSAFVKKVILRYRDLYDQKN